jgi:hypothetical protein
MMFKSLSLKHVYNSEDEDISKSFYLPVLKCATSFDRTSAYFSAKALAFYAEGLEYFGRKGNKYRLIISVDISEEDYSEIKLGYELKSKVSQDMMESMNESLTLKEEKQISNLAFLIAIGVVEIKIAFKKEGIFHDKCGILEDANQDVICFRGSNNETAAAMKGNYESFQLTCSWLDNKGFYSQGIKKSREEFETLWNNEKDGLMVLPVQDIVSSKILDYNKGKLIVEEVLLEKKFYNIGL